ncbi:uncharacterized protein A4U43_C03F25360 [Asparagus officinalis]|uniref:X8 domain-containing protein n=1 Tax=Asparagus officinalis TaxID=4686 RepID=A0A5P1FH54_ASPOF|nr:uncharacterized protein A4U43_C03F25360 [Asparagus officinalis]
MKRKLSSLNPPSFAMVPGSSLSFAPFSSLVVVPANSPDVPAESPLTFCIPPVARLAPDSGDGDKVGLWCVAKPIVLEEKLQEAIDFACGKGGADCDEIRLNGNCFNSDNLVAHASYAFNSHCKKTKQSGGSCNFDGTAILINSDPSNIVMQSFADDGYVMK